MKNLLNLILLNSFLIVGSLAAESDFYKSFKKVYDDIDIDLLNYECETFTVSNFVYQKDLATFTFEEGTIYLGRYVNDRPTTAVFYGKGHARIDVDVDAERKALKSVTRKDHVDEVFELAILRFADDFDLKLKEHATGEMVKMKWKYYSILKDEQADHYFKPVFAHTYDNKFQQARSIFERNSEGFFWIDFNRYNFTYDPNRSEEVVISYEFEVKDFSITDAVYMQKQAERTPENELLSDFIYPTTAVEKKSEFKMGGIDGTKLDKAGTTLSFVINADSLRFISTFLHFNLKLDSLKYNDQPLDYHRRNEFNFIGLMLPEYRYRGDTVSVTYYYHGKDFDYIMPFVADPSPSKISIDFKVPKGYNYIMPAMSEVQELNGDYITFSSNPQERFKYFKFQAYASNYDTLSKTSNLGFPINFIKGKHIKKSVDCYVPDEIYESSIMNAFSFMSQRVGPPPGANELYIFPENFKSMPGLVEVPQILCYEGGSFSALGGFDLFTGYSMSKQWFGDLTKPATDREFWLKEAASLYLSLISVQHNSSSGAYFSNMLIKRDSILIMRDVYRDRPLAMGSRNDEKIFTNRGVWLFHMLRFLLYDLGNGSESKFNRFMYELSSRVNKQEFKNTDIMALAEKYYGESLDWFFDEWFYDCSLPKFDVEYSVEKGKSGYYVNLNVETKNVAPDFKMPMIIRVNGNEDNISALTRETLTVGIKNIQLGPFDFEVKDMVFNELYSVLSEANVKKK